MHLRGILVYTAVTMFACLGLFRNLGPVVFAPLLAGFASASVMFSGVNAVAQLLFFMFVGLVAGVIVESVIKRRRRA